MTFYRPLFSVDVNNSVYVIKFKKYNLNDFCEKPSAVYVDLTWGSG